MNVSKRIAMLCLCIALLSSCTKPELEPPVVATPVPSDYPTDLHGAKLYRIAPEQSMLHILVYRGGAMANLGHNHVISSQSVAGYVWLHDDLARSGFNITQSVNDLIIDDAKTRSDEGSDFQTNVTDSARAGTRTNMLKPEQLDGEHFPVIRLQSVTITGDAKTAQVKVRITIKNQSREVMVPVQLNRDAQALHVRGEFPLKQSDFGITPYSVAMGALQVVDQVNIKFELVAAAIK